MASANYEKALERLLHLLPAQCVVHVFVEGLVDVMDGSGG
jgi:hypothetical protein